MKMEAFNLWTLDSVGCFGQIARGCEKMKNTNISPKNWLLDELHKRQEKNARYSIRAFAKLLDLPSGRVSQLLSGKRSLTRKTGEKIADRLSYDSNTKNQFLEAIENRQKFQKSMMGNSPSSSPAYRALAENQFKLIANPIHYDILSLLETTNFVSDDKWIADRLGVSRAVVAAAIKRLIKIKLISGSEAEGWEFSVFFRFNNDTRCSVFGVEGGP